MNKKNKWIIQITGKSAHLGFLGSKNFVEQGVNFCHNYGVVTDTFGEIRSLGDDGFKFIRTPLKTLVAALREEGRVLKIRSLAKADEDINILDFSKEIEKAGQRHCRREFLKMERSLVKPVSKTKMASLEEYSYG